MLKDISCARSRSARLFCLLTIIVFGFVFSPREVCRARRWRDSRSHSWRCYRRNNCERHYKCTKKSACLCRETAQIGLRSHSKKSNRTKSTS